VTALQAAYLATEYHVEHPEGGFVLRIGARSRTLDRLLDQHGQRTWAFLTAWNPLSVIVPMEQNVARQAQLEAEVQQRGWVMLAGRGQGAGWAAEASVLVLGITEPEAIALGQMFRQAAIVVGTHGESARLVWCGEEIPSEYPNFSHPVVETG
jgi:hypothetical protein